jgi:hypothetical protein
MTSFPCSERNNRKARGSRPATAGIVQEFRQMNSGESSVLEKEISRTDPFENMAVQDAFITLALYVCLSHRTWINYHAKIDKILDLAEKSRLFAEDSESVLSRIYRIINLYRWEDPAFLLRLAADALTPELAEDAFEWAVKLAAVNGNSSQAIRSVLQELAQVLSIECMPVPRS